MSYLNKVITGKLEKNLLMLLYANEGVGKSTFGASAKLPIFLGTESGTSNLDVSRLPVPVSWEEVLAMIWELHNEKHNYKTLVLDTLDWCEHLLFSYLTKDKKPIEDIGGGFGRYVGIVNSEWKKLMSAIEVLNKKMDIIILAHAEVKRFDDPITNQGWDRYQLKLYNQKSSQIWKEFCDVLLFANIEVVVKEGDRKAKAYGEGERRVYTAHRPSFDAKTRYTMPFDLPLDYNVIMSYINGSNELDTLKTEILEELYKLDNEEMKSHIAKLKIITSDKDALIEYLRNLKK